MKWFRVRIQKPDVVLIVTLNGKSRSGVLAGKGIAIVFMAQATGARVT